MPGKKPYPVSLSGRPLGCDCRAERDTLKHGHADYCPWYPFEAAPVVEPEPTSVGNAASDPHLAPYCTNHDGDCVVEPEQPSGNTGEFVEPCEGCPDPELPCKGCPAVELDQPWPSPCCWPARNGMGGHNEGCPVYGVRGGERGADVHVRDTTTNPAGITGCSGDDTRHEPHVHDPAGPGEYCTGCFDQGAVWAEYEERARIERIIEGHRDSYFGDSPGVYDALLRDVRKGD